MNLCASPDHLEGQAVYIIDPEIQEGYEISDKVLMYRYQLAEQAEQRSIRAKPLILLQKFISKTLSPPLSLSRHFAQCIKNFFKK